MPREVLTVAAGTIVQLAGGVELPDVQRLGASLIEPGALVVEDIDVLIFEPGDVLRTLEIDDDRRLVLDAEPGRYLLEVNVIYRDGSGSYGIAVEIVPAA